MASLSAAASSSPSPSRSHWIAAPAMKMAPSSAYAGCPSQSQASVVSTPGASSGRSAPVLQQQEGAGAVGLLPFPAPPAPLAEQRRLLIAGHAGNRNRPSEQVGRGRAEVARRRPHLRQHGHGHAEQGAQLLAPASLADVVEHGARRVRRLRGVHGAAGEPPDEPAVHCSRAQLAALRALGQPLRQQPLELGGREVRIDDEPGARPHHWRSVAPARGTARRFGGPARRWRGATGRPVAASHTTTVSRWLVIPMASGTTPAIASASLAAARVAEISSSASCSTHPGRG